MERGETRQATWTTDFEQPSQRYLDEAIESLASELGLKRDQLNLHGVMIKSYHLESRFDSGHISDDNLTILWHNDKPAAIVLETRNELNNVVSQVAYFGPQTAST